MEGGNKTTLTVEPEQAPFLAPFLGHGQFVAADVERCAVPAIRRLHLDQTGPAISLKAGDVVARAVAILLRYPSHLARQVIPPGGLEREPTSTAAQTVFAKPLKR